MRVVDFLLKLKKVHPRFQLIGSCGKNVKNIKIYCRDCNSKFTVKSEDIFKKSTVCPVCKFKRDNIKNLKIVIETDYEYIKFIDIENSVLRCKKCESTITVRNEDILNNKVECIYCKNKDILENENLSLIRCQNNGLYYVHCKICKRDFTLRKATANKEGCPFCRDNNKYFNEVVEICKKNNLILLSENVNFSEKIIYKCNNCKRLLKMGLNSFLNTKKYCRICYSEMNLTHEEFLKKIKNSNIEILSNYKRMNEHIECRCKECGTFFKETGKRLTSSKQPCPSCREYYKLDSKGVVFIKKWLNTNNINFMSEHTFEDLKYINKLRFDFYLPEFNICIEYDGKQHYESCKWYGGEKALATSKIRDNLKNKYCYKNNIRLLRIKYDLCNPEIKEKLYHNIYGGYDGKNDKKIDNM